MRHESGSERPAVNGAVDPGTASGMWGRIGRFVEGTLCQRVITLLIIVNGITLGLETSPTVMEAVGGVLHVFDKAVLAVFVFEIAGKLGYRRLGFFRDGWNVFDFIIVGFALVPASGPLTVLRALRILRVLRLISVIPQLRRVIQALLGAIPGMVSVVLIIMLLFYVGAVLSTKLFGPSFPEWFGTIGASMYTLFQVMTLESWSMGIVRPVMEVYPSSWIFFVPFIIITSFAILNLFIGIIVDAMQTAHSDEAEALAAEAAKDASPPQERMLAHLEALRTEVADLKERLDQRG